MKIYTKRGDAGETDLFGGQRISKASPQVRAYGAVDAANIAIGYVLASDVDSSMKANLTELMHRLFDVGAELSTKDDPAAHQKRKERMGEGISSQHIQEMEKWIDEADAQLEPLSEFVLPTGCETACRLHLARSAVRKAEVEVISLASGARAEIIQYLNRLSDLLFVYGRLENLRANYTEIPWKKAL